jgi:peptidoglycan/xylan/chitin deacetylase (PgdA/CDA1 family)
VSSSCFCTTSQLRRNAIWGGVRRMAQRGHEVGSHSMTHADLVALHATDPHAVHWELRESARLIEQQVRALLVATPKRHAYEAGHRWAALWQSSGTGL